MLVLVEVFNPRWSKQVPAILQLHASNSFELIMTSLQICGEASAGKTQIGIQALLHAALPDAFSTAAQASTPAPSARASTTASAVYLNTEGRFPMTRAQQLELALLAETNSTLPPGAAPLQGGALLNRCLISDIPDAAALIKAVTVQLPAALEQHASLGAGDATGTATRAAKTHRDQASRKSPSSPSSAGRQSSIRLVVLDSIASVLRAEFDTSGRKDSFARAQYMYDLSSALKALIHSHGIAVLVINQVTASSVELGNAGSTMPLSAQMRACGCSGGAGRAAADAAAAAAAASGNTLFSGLSLDGGGTKAALGAVWSHCVSARVMLTRAPPPSALPPLSVPVTLPKRATAAALAAFQRQAQRQRASDVAAATGIDQGGPTSGATRSDGGGPTSGAGESQGTGGDATSSPPTGGTKRARAAEGGAVSAVPAPWPSDSVSLAAGAALEPEALLDCTTVDKGALRWAHVQFSPWSANNGALYTVTAAGVQGVVLVQQ